MPDLNLATVDWDTFGAFTDTSEPGFGKVDAWLNVPVWEDAEGNKVWDARPKDAEGNKVGRLLRDAIPGAEARVTNWDGQAITVAVLPGDAIVRTSGGTLHHVPARSERFRQPTGVYQTIPGFYDRFKPVVEKKAAAKRGGRKAAPKAEAPKAEED